MKAIETITGRSRVLMRANVDTDQIIPKQFLKRVERTGFGKFLFYDWAKEDGWDLPVKPDPGRPPQLRLRLQPRARALGAGGLRLPRRHRHQLRRHLQYNCFKNGMLPVRLTERAVQGDRRVGSAQVDLTSKESAGKAPTASRWRPSSRRDRTACSKASTTSPSRSSRASRSTPTSVTANVRGRSPPPCNRKFSSSCALVSVSPNQQEERTCSDAQSQALPRSQPSHWRRPAPQRGLPRQPPPSIPASRSSPRAPNAPPTSSSPVVERRISAKQRTARAPAAPPTPTAAPQPRCR